VWIEVGDGLWRSSAPDVLYHRCWRSVPRSVGQIAWALPADNGGFFPSL